MGKQVKKNRDQRNSRYSKATRTNEPFKKRPSDLPKGLHNLGNTCYLNSSLQCLSRSPFLYKLLSSPPVNAATLKRPDGNSVASLQINLPVLQAPVTKQFINLISRLRDSHVESFTDSLNPGALREAIFTKYPRFGGFGQQDSHELLRALLDCIKQEEMMRWRKGILDKLNLDMKNVSQEDRELVRTWGRASSIATVIDRLFGGILVSSLECCRCGAIRTTFEPFLDLSLPIVDYKLPLGRQTQNTDRKQIVKKKSKQELKRERRQKGKKGRHQARRAVTNFRLSTSENEAHIPSDHVENAIEAVVSEDPINGVNGRPEPESPMGGEPVSINGNGISDPPFIQTQSICGGDSPDSAIDVVQSDFIRVGSDESTDGSFADIEDSDLDQVVRCLTGTSTEPLSTACAADEDSQQLDSAYSQRSSLSIDSTTAASYLIKQLDQLHLEDLDDLSTTPFSTHEIIQASRLSQIPLRIPCPNDEASSKNNNKNAEDLYRCLARFTSPEHLTGPNRISCENCQKSKVGSTPSSYTDAYRRDLILEPPPLLTIHLKRFQQCGPHLQKSQKSIHFPLLLDLSSFCSTLYLPSSDSVNYRLYGIVEHIGRLTSGHYVAYISTSSDNNEAAEPCDHSNNYLTDLIGSLKCPPKWPFTNHDLVRRLRRCDRQKLSSLLSHISDTAFTHTEHTNSINRTSESDEKLDSNSVDNRTWYRCSDTHVTKVSWETVSQCQPFLLFYERHLN